MLMCIGTDYWFLLFIQASIGDSRHVISSSEAFNAEFHGSQIKWSCHLVDKQNKCWSILKLYPKPRMKYQWLLLEILHFLKNHLKSPFLFNIFKVFIGIRIFVLVIQHSVLYIQSNVLYHQVQYSKKHFNTLYMKSTLFKLMLQNLQYCYVP